MAEYTPGRGAPTGAAGRDARHVAVLRRWPVIAEPWAQRLEARRVDASVSGEVSPAARVGANAAEQGITPLQAINRALGLPDDHGVDEVQRRRGDLG
ncbi:MAG: hypothetical protein ACPGRF_04120 [Miltoncostaeaceae bacterium]